MAQDHDLQETSRQGDSIQGMSRILPCRLELRSNPVPAGSPRQSEAKRLAHSRTMPQYSDASDVQLHLRRLELQHEREREERQQQFELKKLELKERQRQRARLGEKEERQQQYELKKLELEMSRASDPSAQPTVIPAASFGWKPPLSWCLRFLSMT